MGYMIHAFCACRGVEWRRLDSPDIVTWNHDIPVPASGEPLLTPSLVLEGVDVARQHVWP